MVGTPRFSERIGLVKRVLQKDSMDDALKNALWNVSYSAMTDIPQLPLDIVTGHYHLPAHRYQYAAPFELYDVIHKHYLSGSWAATYEFIEYVAVAAFHLPIAPFNEVLESHYSSYRFVGEILAPITSDQEIAEIQLAIVHSGKFAPAAKHIETALLRLADKPQPDARNSIKESISAVEATCKIIANSPNATLADALKQLGIHAALERGFKAIYGYTSDADGIRHALSNESTVDGDDARFFLVSCSAFVNYLITKSDTP